MRRYALRMIGALACAACTTEEIVSVDPEDAPGQSAPTVEAVFTAADLAGWTDTVFFGFTRAADACRAPGQYVRVEEGTLSLASRALIRFVKTGLAVFPDSIAFADTISSVLNFDSARVVLTVDSARSDFPEGGSTVQLLAVEEDWDGNSATWELAVDSLGVQVLWSTPGGALGVVLSDTVVTSADDSVVFQLGAASDSLTEAWSDTTQVNTGLAVMVADSGRLVGLVPRLRYQAVPEVDPDTTVELVPAAPRDCTFIFDPSGPAVSGGVLRVGGVDGWRAFVEVLIPDSVTVAGFPDGLQMRGASVARAELVLVSREPPDPPFGAELSFSAVAFELADDFKKFGAKTPVSEVIDGSAASIDPDSLASGSLLAVNLTDVVQDLVDTPPDSAIPPLRAVVRATPEAATFGFWEFGAVDGDSAFAPVLRIIFTPPTDFAIP